MRYIYLRIRNFKSIRDMEISDIDNVLILVGRNNTGKSVALDAIRAISGDYDVKDVDFHSQSGKLIITAKLRIYQEDLDNLHRCGLVSNFKNYDYWIADFLKKLPSYDAQTGVLSFEFVFSRDGKKLFRDGISKNNEYIPMVVPKIYFVDHFRSNVDLKHDLLELGQDSGLGRLQDNECIFDSTRKCNQCFDCIGLINKKKPQELSLLESARLLQYKLVSVNLTDFAAKVNESFEKNGALSERVRYELKFDSDEVFKIVTMVSNRDRGIEQEIDSLGEGLRSIYILSLLETYAGTDNISPYIIMIEEPEMFLHPQMKKLASRVLYRLSKKNQVIFSTHEPEMLFNFNSRQIKQVILDNSFNTTINKHTNIDEILNDLGFTANDLLNVSFVFIVEGKQDRNRLPLLLKHYYSEIVTDDDQLKRVAIIATNSCTNIKTYANLKYINSLYLKDQFMLIRDGDGKDAKELTNQLTGYYKERSKHDKGKLPRVTEENVLILKYYSFENYFLFPEVMAKIGVVESVDAFYDILWAKYKEYLHKLSSTRNMLEKCHFSINSRADVIEHMEDIRKYVRGHNLFDIFYGRYKNRESEILTKYIEEAPPEVFGDILEKINSVVFFQSKKKR